MSDALFEYEVLPQRAPRTKRKRPEPPAQQDDDAADRTNQDKDVAPIETQNNDDGKQQNNEQQVDGDKAGADDELEHHTVDKYRSAAEQGYNFEYLDHTADVQLHAWGKTLEEAFESVGLAMFNYMTPLEGIDSSSPASETRTYEAEAHDLSSLLYNYLDELLFGFSTDFFVPGKLTIEKLDRENWRIVAKGQGEKFDRSRHACGTEIKAITYSAMQINEKPGDSEVFVIVDI